jgi:hypothetical protein
MAILTLAAVSVVTAAPAGAVTGTVQFPRPATLVEHGLEVDVPVTVAVTCDEGYDLAIINVFVSQARGTAAVFGQGQSSPVSCAGEPQNLTVQVFGGVYHGGSALATAAVMQCRSEPDFGLTCAETQLIGRATIRIRG